jgi:hypothetical protein
MSRNDKRDAGVIRVFLSYSWDSEAHKRWVLDFAGNLRSDGVDAVIDQTHLPLGARNPEFMERSVRESDRVLVVCTEAYKRRFDSREGGAGYEGHVITGEIVDEVGTNKFIPVLRSGEWKSSLPTALSGVAGVDLRSDSPEEYRKLLENLHGISHIAPVGPRPKWLALEEPDRSVHAPAQAVSEADTNEYLKQRGRLPETGVLRKIWSKPRWQIWIRPTDFRRARFRDAKECRQFMLSSYVRTGNGFDYPSVPAAIEIGDEWVAGETDYEGRTVCRAERWVLHRSGQFVQNRAFDENTRLGERIHVLEVLDTVTAAFEFAARMARRGVLSPTAVIRFELHSVDGRQLTWPRDALGDMDAVGRDCWSQNERVVVERQATAEELEHRRRDLAFEVSLEIYSNFGWKNPPTERLRGEQATRFPG